MTDTAETAGRVGSAVQKRRGGMCRGQHVNRTHCRRGHPLTDDNIEIDKHGHRKCKQCRRDKNARSNRRTRPMELRRKREATAIRRRIREAAPDMLAALHTAVRHIEHMAAWISKQNAGYSFEGLGEDMPGMRAAIARAEGRAP